MKLNHEAYYADVHKMSFHGGKRWIAPEQLIKEEVSWTTFDGIYLTGLVWSN
jgi:ATPase complex subunit ATP10